MSDPIESITKALDTYDAINYTTHPSEKEEAWNVIVGAAHSWLRYILSEIARLNTDVRVQCAEIEELEGETSALRRGTEAAFREGFDAGNLAACKASAGYGYLDHAGAWQASESRKQLETVR